MPNHIRARVSRRYCLQCVWALSSGAVRQDLCSEHDSPGRRGERPLYITHSTTDKRHSNLGDCAVQQFPVKIRSPFRHPLPIEVGIYADLFFLFRPPLSAPIPALFERRRKGWSRACPRSECGPPVSLRMDKAKSPASTGNIPTRRAIRARPSS